MKKLISLMMALALLLSVGAAMAETIPDPAAKFNVTLTLPEGAVIANTVAQSDFTMTEIDFSDEKLPNYLLTIAPTEEFVGKSMTDLTDDEIQLIYSEVAGDIDQPKQELKTLANGLKVLYVSEEGEYVADYLLTMYQGYFIQLTCVYDDYADIDDAALQTAFSLLEGLTLIAVE